MDCGEGRSVVRVTVGGVTVGSEGHSGDKGH